MNMMISDWGICVNKNPHGTKTLASWGYAGGNGI